MTGPRRRDARKGGLVSRLPQGGRVLHPHTDCMARTETHVAASGTTTVPKVLRDAMQMPNGARLRWELQPDGTLLVTVVSRYLLPADLLAIPYRCDRRAE